jgi:hypothetical protein
VVFVEAAQATVHLSARDGHVARLKKLIDNENNGNGEVSLLNSKDNVSYRRIPKQSF